MKQTKNKSIDLDILIKRSDVSKKLILIVEGFVRMYEEGYKIFIPQQILDVILFMYAKPIVIKMEYKNSTSHIMLCIITDNWNSIISKTMKCFNMSFFHFIAIYLIKIFYKYEDEDKRVGRESCINEMVHNADKIFEVKHKPRLNVANEMPEKHLLETLFEFFCTPLQIDINKLSLDEQLNIVEFDGISSIDKRKQKIKALCDKIPDLKQSVYKQIEFESILSSFYKKYIELETKSLSEWSVTELPLSLFIYCIKFLQKPDIFERDKKYAGLFFHWVYFTLKYCNEESLDGKQLILLCNDKSDHCGLGLRYLKLICTKFLLYTGPFTKVKKHTNIWYKESLEKNITINEVQPKVLVSESIESRQEKWYWMDLEELKWIQYQDVDQQILNQAYTNKEGKCNVVNGKYTVD
eukprot:58355_1